MHRVKRKYTMALSDAEARALLDPSSTRIHDDPIPKDVKKEEEEEEAEEEVEKEEPIHPPPNKRRRKKKNESDPYLEPAKIPYTLTAEQVAHINRNGIGPCIHNIVATACFPGYNPDVINLAWLIGAKRDLGGFSAPCKLQMKEPRCTLSSYGTGRAVSTGTQSPDQALLSFTQYAKFIERKTGARFVPRDVLVCNMQATFYTGYTVDLEKLKNNICASADLAKGIDAVKFKLEDPKLTVLVYPTGSCVLTGSRTVDSLEKGLTILRPILAECFVRESTKQEQIAEKKRFKENRQTAHFGAKAAHRFARVRSKVMKLGKAHTPFTKTRNIAKNDVSAIVGIRQIWIDPKCVAPKKIANRKKPVAACTHEVFVLYSDTYEEEGTTPPTDGLWCPLGRMDLAAINKLSEANNYPLVSHVAGGPFEPIAATTAAAAATDTSTTASSSTADAAAAAVSSSS